VIRALAAHGETYPRRHDLTSLRILGSTGEPWNTKPYRWFAKEIDGGILGCFPTMPLAPNACHGPIPGMRADILDAAGASLREGVGELVLRSSWPGMTQSLWGDVVVCFVAVRAGVAESEALRARLKEGVERALGHALLLKRILFANELPRTRNQKILRRVLRAQYLRLEDLGDLSGLEIVTALEAIKAAR
jgi:acyl-coenzyme A synthetase/AMP-(fatty) acid ligase